MTKASGADNPPRRYRNDGRIPGMGLRGQKAKSASPQEALVAERIALHKEYEHKLRVNTLKLQALSNERGLNSRVVQGKRNRGGVMSKAW